MFKSLIIRVFSFEDWTEHVTLQCQVNTKLNSDFSNAVQRRILNYILHGSTLDGNSLKYLTIN